MGEQQAATRRVRRAIDHAPVHDDRWRNLVGVVADRWPMVGTWRHRIVRRLVPDLAAALDEVARAERLAASDEFERLGAAWDEQLLAPLRDEIRTLRADRDVLLDDPRT